LFEYMLSDKTSAFFVRERKKADFFDFVSLDMFLEDESLTGGFFDEKK